MNVSNIINSKKLYNLYDQIFDYFKVKQSSDMAKSVQLEGGHMIFKKTNHTKDYLNEFRKVMDYDQDLITDKKGQKYFANLLSKPLLSNKDNPILFEKSFYQSLAKYIIGG